MDLLTLDAKSPFIHALYQSDLEKVQQWLEAHPEDLHKVFVSRYELSSPLKVAFGLDDLSIAHYLINQGADLNEQDEIKNETVLMKMVRSYHHQAVSWLLQEDFKPLLDVNLQNHLHQTALMLAAAFNEIQMVRELIAAGAHVNTVGHQGETALLMSLEGFYNPENRLAVVKELVQAGADLTVKNGDGLTLVEIARQKGKKECADFLETASLIQHESLALQEITLKAMQEVGDSGNHETLSLGNPLKRSGLKAL